MERRYSAFSVSRYSLLFTRAMVLLAPNFLASIAEFIFCSSSGFTAMYKSHFPTCASLSAPIEVHEPTTERMSIWLSSSSSFSPSASISMIQCSCRLSIRARWVPTAPAPAMTIFILLSLYYLRGKNIVNLYQLGI